MKSGVTPKTIFLCFCSVLLVYFVVFTGIESWRHKNGPWKVTFSTDATGQPSILIEQEKLNVADLRLVFPGQTLEMSNMNQQVTFARPEQPLPFGKRLHEDLVSLPGVQTLELFGHQIELFPRSLRIDGTEHPWQSNSTFQVKSAR